MLLRALTFYALAIFVSMHQTAGAAEIKVAVASNFTNTAKVLAENFEKSTHHTITLLVGSSGKHLSQIRFGLDVDVFMAADVERPALLEKMNLAQTGSRKTYAFGRLVVWRKNRNLSDLNAQSASAILRAQGQQPIAIANPKLAPYGLAAKELFESLSLEPQLVYGESVAQAFQFVNGGGAQLGILALSQVHNLELGSYFLWPESHHQAIAQQMLIVKSSAQAKAWYDYVLSESGQAIIESSGYRRANLEFH